MKPSQLVKQRLPAWLLKTPVWAMLLVFVSYLAIGYWAVGPVGKWAAEKYVHDKLGHRLTLDPPEFDPLRLTLRLRHVELDEPEGGRLLGFDNLLVDFDASSLLRFAYTFDRIRLIAPWVNADLRADGQLNFARLIAALNKDKTESTTPRLLVHRLDIEQGRLDFADHTLKLPFSTRLSPLDLHLTELSTLPDDKGAYSLSAKSALGASFRWKGTMELKPLKADGEVEVDQLTLAKLWPYIDGLKLAPPTGTLGLKARYQIDYDAGELAAKVHDLSLDMTGFGLTGPGAKTPSLAFDRIELGGGQLDLASRKIDIGSLHVSGGHLDAVRQADGRLDWQGWLPAPQAAKAARSTPAKAAPAGAPWTLALGEFKLDGFGLGLTDQTFVNPLKVDAAALTLGFGLHGSVGADAPQVAVDKLALGLSGVRLGAANQPPLAVIGGIEADGGTVDLGQHQARLAHLAVLNGKLSARRMRDGRIDWLEALKSHGIAKPVTSPVGEKTTPKAARKRSSAPAKTVATKADDDAWHAGIDEVALREFEVGLRDETVKPAVALDLIHLGASLQHVSDNLNVALPLHAGFQVRQGGRFDLNGTLLPAKGAVAAKLALNGLPLKVAQPYIAQQANLTLVDGRASLHGALKTAGGVKFDGGFSVDDLLLNETDGGARFLAWKKLSSDSLHLTGKGLTLNELAVSGLGAKLVIYEDKSVNLKRILKQAAASPEPAPAAPPAAKPSAKPAPASAPFAVNVERVQIENGELDFADLSLRPQFGTRIHDLKGRFNDISSQPGAAAQLEIDGQVDDFGLARAAGEINLFDPAAFTDIKTVFRNVEMTALSPYSGKFAGYRIASGKLSLDLEYKIKDRQLSGENQIIMDQLTLGERVDSPDAMHLPLELALAILKDSDGKIDLGLPVSGSLDDPQFSYARIVWKAIGNILTKIVTAPFRALGKLFGIGGDKLEKIAFDAGSATLLPPEKEKLKTLAQALAKRPNLALTVQGVWSPEADRRAMQELQLRRALAQRMGLKVMPDGDPGPMSTHDAKVQQALETYFSEQFGDKVYDSLRAAYMQANPDQAEAMKSGHLLSRLTGLFKKTEPASAEELAALKGADYYGVLYQRLHDHEPVEDARLIALAQARGDAALQALRGFGADPARLAQGSVEKIDSDSRDVAIKLVLGVAKTVAVAPAQPVK